MEGDYHHHSNVPPWDDEPIVERFSDNATDTELLQMLEGDDADNDILEQMFQSPLDDGGDDWTSLELHPHDSIQTDVVEGSNNLNNSNNSNSISNSSSINVECYSEFDVDMLVSALCDGPSVRHYSEEPANLRLLIILLGESRDEFPRHDGCQKMMSSLLREPTTIPMLRAEVKRRIEVMKVPLGKRVPPSHLSRVQLEDWLSKNPVLLEEEKPYFKRIFATFVQSCNNADDEPRLSAQQMDTIDQLLSQNDDDDDDKDSARRNNDQLTEHDVTMVVESLWEGPSIKSYQEEPSDDQLLLILLGESELDFPGLMLALGWAARPAIHTLRAEVKRRTRFLSVCGASRRVPPSQMNKKQLERWLKENPGIQEEEKQYFQWEFQKFMKRKAPCGLQMER